MVIKEWNEKKLLIHKVFSDKNEFKLKLNIKGDKGKF